MNRQQLAAWAGMIGPTLFVAVFTLEGWLRPGYDPLRMFVSELALGPRGWIQAVNFVVLGVLFLLFTWGVAAEFRDGKASMTGPTLLMVIGISFLASGFFVMDPVGTPRDQLSLSGRLHGFFGALVFSLSTVSCFVFWRRFREDPKWRHLRWWTIAAGTITAVAVLLQSVVPAPPPAPPSPITELDGLIQRTALVTFLVWVFTFAWGLRGGRTEAGMTDNVVGGM